MYDLRIKIQVTNCIVAGIQKVRQVEVHRNDLCRLLTVRSTAALYHSGQYWELSMRFSTHTNDACVVCFSLYSAVVYTGFETTQEASKSDRSVSFMFYTHMHCIMHLIWWPTENIMYVGYTQECNKKTKPTNIGYCSSLVKWIIITNLTYNL